LFKATKEYKINVQFLKNGGKTGHQEGCSGALKEKTLTTIK
jgi:hypothetical protein